MVDRIINRFKWWKACHKKEKHLPRIIETSDGFFVNGRSIPWAIVGLLSRGNCFILGGRDGYLWLREACLNFQLMLASACSVILIQNRLETVGCFLDDLKVIDAMSIIMDNEKLYTRKMMHRYVFRSDSRSTKEEKRIKA